MNVLDLKPGDLVRNNSTGEVREVVSFSAFHGRIEFDDSNLVGWQDAQNWVPTGENAAGAPTAEAVPSWYSPHTWNVNTDKPTDV